MRSAPRALPSRRPLSLCAALLLAGCGAARPVTRSEPAGLLPALSAGAYASPERWLCLPEREGDACHADLSATELRADGTLLPEARANLAPAAVDCFYVYPTVDLSLEPGNHTDFRDTAPMARAAQAQAARFREVCSVYAPLYRQITLGTYLRDPEGRERRLAAAFEDVSLAFAHYLTVHNRGRPLVLLGHSQGADMVQRLLRRYFDRDDALRSRLLLALVLGGDVETTGSGPALAGLERIPLCTSAEQTGCVVAYRTHRAGSAVDPGPFGPAAGRRSACVNPASLGSEGEATFARSYFPLWDSVRSYYRGVAGVRTPYVLVREAYSGRCVDGPAGYRYLAVSAPSAPGDARASLLSLARDPLGPRMGLHLLDAQFPQGDLLDAVARRARRVAEAPRPP